MVEPFKLTFADVGEMTLPQASFLLNGGKFPSPHRREFGGTAAAERWIREGGKL